MYCAFEFQGGILCGVLSIIWLMWLIDRTESSIVRCAYVIIFVTVYVFLQFSFIINKAISENWEIILVDLLIIVLYITPICVFSGLRTRFRVEFLLIGIFVSEIVFVNLEIGNLFFQYGLLLTDFTSIIQWYEYTGIYGGTLWILLFCWGLYKATQGRYSWWPVCLIVVIPISLSMLIEECESDSFLRTAIISLSNNNDVKDIYKLSNNECISDVDFIVLPEGTISADENMVLYNPLITYLKRISHKNNIPVSVGIFAYSGEKRSNAVMLISDRDVFRRYKQLMIPFSEYLPYQSVLSGIPFLRECLLYNLENKQNINELYKWNEWEVAPLICYEALSLSYVLKQVRIGADIFIVSSSNSYIDSYHLEKISKRIIKANAIVAERSFARVAEHGVSFFVNPDGEVLFDNNYKTEVLSSALKLNSSLTFYARYETLINSLYLVVVLILIIMLNLEINSKMIQFKKEY